MRYRALLKKLIVTMAFSGLMLGAYAGDSVEKKAELIHLYESNNDKKIMRTLSPTTPLVKIYREGDWVKVGNRQDGTVGWINLKQYHQAMDAFYQPDVQEIFITRSVNKDDKPQVKVVAYNNGQPVSEKEAKALYRDIQQQQKWQEQLWHQFRHDMLRWQHMMWQTFNDDLWLMPPMRVSDSAATMDDNPQAESKKK